MIVAGIAVVAGIVAISVILLMLRRVTRNNRNVDESSQLWEKRAYRCPACDTPMRQGYVLLGKGMIWMPRGGKRISTFAHIGQSLDNTMSLALPPALNMAWHCDHCKLTTVDHSKLVKVKK